MLNMLVYDLVAILFLEYKNIKYVEVFERPRKITNKFHVINVIGLYHL